MRFMMFMYPELADEGKWTPSTENIEEIEAMSRYNEELQKAGRLLALDGLRPPRDGATVSFRGDEVTVTDGPFTEAKEVVGGYWVIQAGSTEEAIELAKRCPGRDCRIEVRPIFELEDFTAEVQAVI